MPRRPHLDHVDLFSLFPSRVAAVGDLVALGLSSATLARRVQAGRWQRPFPGVIAMQSGPLTRSQELAAARLFAGAGAVITGVEAARRHGLRNLPESRRIDLLVEHDHQRRSAGLAVIHRTAELPAGVERDGELVAPLDRSVADAVKAMSGRQEVLALLAEVVQRQRSTVARLRLEIDRNSQRGSAVPRAVLGEVGDGVRSVAEGWGTSVYARSALPDALWNSRLYLPNGRFLASPDAFIDEVAMAWELDSVLWHPEGEDDTARRRADMTAAGVVVVHHRPRRLLTEPDRVIAELWSYYQLAASRPRPAIRAVPASRAA